MPELTPRGWKKIEFCARRDCALDHYVYFDQLTGRVLAEAQGNPGSVWGAIVTIPFGNKAVLGEFVSLEQAQWFIESELAKTPAAAQEGLKQ